MMHVDGRWYEFGGTFIDDAPMNCNVLNFNGDLKSDESGEVRFSAVEIKCDELSIRGVDCPQGGK
jgi:hypothetical protein